ncbi:MAG: PLP-dependent aminotransferase family protein [Polaromonas sp.]|nr:PLP-dependent aminotransferase family protein [Polaromonas sp.]
MKSASKSLDWVPTLEDAPGPIYFAIADAIAKSVASGKLAPGARLPPQRALAAALGIDFTTVSRGYAEAGRRGLVEGRVGQGTYVLANSHHSSEPGGAGVVNMSVNHPPLIESESLVALLRDSLRGLAAGTSIEQLRCYLPPEGAMNDRVAGVQWLEPHLGRIAVERVLVCAGTQSALLAIVNLLVKPGEAICVDELTHSGLRMLAHRMGIRLVPVAADAHGMLPQALAAAARSRNVKAIYCIPTLHNPTTTTMPRKRREAIAEVARKVDLPIIEDDSYWPLIKSRQTSHPSEGAMPALASLAPERVYHVSGLAKAVAPALRIAYVVVPDLRTQERLAPVVKATSSMVASLSASLATRWIRDGTVNLLTNAIRDESRARQAIVDEVLGDGLPAGDRRGFHLWFPLPAPWARSAFISQLRRQGVLVTESDAFAVDSAPEAVRLCIGAPASRAELTRSLEKIADLIGQPASVPSLV